MVNATVSLESKDAVYNSEIGLLLLDEPSGRIGNLLPGELGYAKAALNSDRIRPIFSPLSEIGTNQTLMVAAGKYLAVYAIVNGTTEQWLNLNPDNSSSKMNYALFSLSNANPDGLNHFNRLLACSLALEDLLGGGDFDFNDLLFNIRWKRVVS